MADISLQLSRIRTAIYGEEVRGSIHDAISAINDESSKAKSDASAAKESAKASAKSASDSAKAALDSAAEALRSENNAKEYADQIENRVFGANVMVGATDAADGQSGFVPSPTKGEQNKFLRGNGQWEEIVTRLENVEDGADVKALPTESDYIPIIDSADKNKMKKTLVSKLVKDHTNASASTDGLMSADDKKKLDSGYMVKKDGEGYYIEV